MNYQDKVVLVTGSSNGIGKCISLEFLKAGAMVIGLDIDELNGELLLTEYKKKGYKADFYKLDLTKVDDIKVIYQKITAKYQKVDILINNAGKGNFKPFLELNVEDWEEVINLNLRATFVMAQEFVKRHPKDTYGRIINISSTRYLMSEPGSEAYAASKGGIISLTHALALSVSSRNFTVNVISPGWIENNNYKDLLQ